VDAAESYAEFGIPEPAPCPSWCDGTHVISDVGPARAAERNMARMAAIARLISPEAEERARQLARLMEETRIRQADPAAAR